MPWRAAILLAMTEEFFGINVSSPEYTGNVKKSERKKVQFIRAASFSPCPLVPTFLGVLRICYVQVEVHGGGEPLLLHNRAL